MTRNGVLTAAGVISVPAGVATLGWPAAVVVTVVVAMVLGVLCWVVADAGRARRLAALIRSWRCGPDR